MSDTICIRMYNVGFGDCFLLTLPEKRTMLVDAGFHSQGKGRFSGDELADQIIQDLRAITGKARIDVVVATHRHQDHVFAFNSSQWKQVEVGEVWLPWVENRRDKEATRLWKKNQKFAMQLAAVAPSFSLQKEKLDVFNFMLWNAGVDLPGFGFQAWSNAGALDCLHEGFASRDRGAPRFLPETESIPESFETPALPGVRVHILGPARKAELIADLDPEADGETYRALALLAANNASPGQLGSTPFSDTWQVPDEEQGFRLDSIEIDRLKKLAQGADIIFAAEKLDGMINSTSLVLVLQVGKARLLLPGDAEWGTWKRILEDDDARALLRGATFLKIGHHGSHNATSRTLLETILPREISAMISTQAGVGNFRNNIPLEELMDALTQRAVHYVRSDQVNAELPDGFVKSQDGRWIDLHLPY
ncbi:MAG: ComEC family competence protein [Nitrospira sp.]|nr:MAG: ComEC family competence protein [Nitrospira sp.]